MNVVLNCQCRDIGIHFRDVAWDLEETRQTNLIRRSKAMLRNPAGVVPRLQNRSRNLLFTSSVLRNRHCLSDEDVSCFRWCGVYKRDVGRVQAVAGKRNPRGLTNWL